MLDELNCTVLLDEALAKEFDTMTPWYSIPAANRPYGISNLVSLLAPCNSLISNYLLDKTTDPHDHDTVIDRMRFKTVEI